ncbi:hypothetical protein [Catellatospora chokoriensis]|uniref:Uncharacterized protein n=1 Tax=Catellatospora chokoriensis TaxID=310353 RepID=A0A8J3NTC2_9ACTN|nr:hypothetical protein [Catellatospora chokoriensis]GIF91930.1 hypothetical protein Cch02nite_53740 [Catellatospora chokoriensis]
MNEPRPPVEGTWELAILTPLGRQHTVLTLTRRDGKLPASRVTGQRATPADG